MSKIEHYLQTDPVIVEAVVGYIVDRATKKVLLVERIDPRTGLGKDKVSGVGGSIEKGEVPEEAFRREVKEETGVSLLGVNYMGEVTFLWPYKPEWNMHVYVYTSDQYEGSPQYMEGERVKPFWFDLDEIPYEKMFEDNKYFIPQVLDGKIVEATFLYNEEEKISESVVTFRELKKDTTS